MTTTGSLSENPIWAREMMRGMDSADLIARALTAFCFLLTTAGVVSFGSPGLYVLLLGAVVALQGYRAAGKMSQIVTEEVEGSTLETVRSTPMGSERFMHGWLMAVLRPQMIDTAVLLGAVAVSMVGLGYGGMLFRSSALMSVALCFLLPVAGAYIGASIAGQAQSRSQISGQLLLSFGLFSVDHR